jgi:hypothetical protein
MGHPDGAHTHGGGGFDPMPILIVIAAVAVMGPVMAAVAAIVHVLLIVLAVLAGIAATGVVALAAFHVHRWRAGCTVQRSLPAPPRQQAVQAAPVPRPVQAPRQQRPAIERGGQLHLHFHGVDAEDVAAIIEWQQDKPMTGDLRHP